MLASAAVERLFPLLLVFALVAPACTAVTGDACQSQSDCGTKMYCEPSLTDGYCTRKDCETSGCSDEGVCVVFYQTYPDPVDGSTSDEVAASSFVSYCMRQCSKRSDCRGGYECVKDYGPHAFCSDSRGVVPGSG